MFFNPSQRARLLRESPWPNAQALAEELYAMSGNEERADFRNGVHIQTDQSGIPLVTASVFPESDEVPLATFNRGGQEFVLTLSIDGSNFGGFNLNGDPVSGPLSTPGFGGGGGGGGNVFTGTVVSGSGSTYDVTLNNGVTVSVTQMQIDSGETIPAGTSVIVVKVNSVYRMQVPVWM